MGILTALTKRSRLIALSLCNLFLITGLAAFSSTIRLSKFISLSRIKLHEEKLIKNKYSSNVKQISISCEDLIPANQISSPLLLNCSPTTEIDFYVGPQDFPLGGPGQPEMASFSPVGADNMVDLFSGDFSYNIPLLDVGGYPINIFYNSGITMDQEASWVGLGWNINPGTISRNMRGLPDDFNGTEQIEQREYLRDDNTYGVSVGAGLEFFGRAFNLNAKLGIFYNNRLGIGMEAGVHPSITLGKRSTDKQTSHLNFGYGLQANSKSGASQSFSVGISKEKGDVQKGSLTANVGIHSRAGLQSLHLAGELPSYVKFDKKSQGIKSIKDGFEINSGYSSSISFAYPAFSPSITTKTRSSNWSLDLGTGVEGWGAFAHLRLGGYYTNISISPDKMVTKKPAFGYLYMQDGNENKDALLDFNRLNDGMYTPNSPVIAIPAYTYDVFSISGEGTGGSFRAYRGDIGYVNDHYNETESFAGHLGIEIGAGAYDKGSVNANLVFTPSSSGVWEQGNIVKATTEFKHSQGDYESVYFKNPGEKSIPDQAFQETILGGDDMVRFKMSSLGHGSPLLVPQLVRYGITKQRKTGLDINLSSQNVLKSKRDKRTQVISFLTADEAARIGLNKSRPSVNAYTDSVRTYYGCLRSKVDSLPRVDDNMKPHHLSEINVMADDGKRYVYGLPVYNLKQVDVSFNRSGTVDESQVTYLPGRDNVPGANFQGKDYYVQSKITPAYAHSFLLSGILSSNYVDVTGDGITEDDVGDAVKFNYSKMDAVLKWRTPVNQNKASFNEGLKTDVMDDKAHYVYGEREIWYLYSIESKNMVARFYINKSRLDGKSVMGEHGGRNNLVGASKLDKISLFSKAELAEKGENAKPVKTIHFLYDYSLCNGNPLSVGDTGKLTLKEIYFTYNGNEKQKENKYKFNYSSLNPVYDYVSNDRWGNYKMQTQNPGNLTNSDFPYCGVNKENSDVNVTAWTLQQIGLPSGASINVEYESDDYAFVQDRRASDMFQITGFGDSKTPNSVTVQSSKLYKDADQNHDFIYVKVPREITATNEAAIKKQIEAFYFGNISSHQTKQLFLKLAVIMPSDFRGSGYEFIPIYADILDYGLVSDGTNKTIYIQVKKVESGETPMVQHSIQFLQNFLPSKAYDGYDVSENGNLRAVVKSLGALFSAFKENFSKGIKNFKRDLKCQKVVLDKSFVRLTNPYLQKLGGGLRVKKITIDDNWDKMTNTSSNPMIKNGLEKSTYGQEYFYTKNEMVNGVLDTVSSGVAVWEPVFGGDENPHREIMSYFNKNTLGPYDFGSVELPLAEMFFPSPGVGYSRVEVRSIHRDTVKNAAGVQVTEYYTAKEFPTKYNYTPLEEYDAKDPYNPKGIFQLLKIDLRKAISLSQGFIVDLNDMHGKMKKQSTYSPLNLEDPISYTENFYSMEYAGSNRYKLNHKFPVINAPDGVINENGLIGREIELMVDFRQHKLETITTNMAFNVDVIAGALIPIPVPTFFPPVMYESNIYRSASILKVVNRYGMLDSIVVMDKGSVISTKNLVFDAETGNPVVTRTENHHKKPVYNFSYPAYWAYEGMGMAYKNIDVVYNGVTFRHGKLEHDNVNMDLFESGDEIYVLTSAYTGPDINVGCDPDYYVKLIRSFIPVSVPVFGSLPNDMTTRKIWAVDKNKGKSLQEKDWMFINAKGEPYTAKDVSIRIVRSGKRNMVSAQVGSIVSLNSPIRKIDNITKLVFDNNTKVLNAGTATYKDHWRIDNALLYKDSIIKGGYAFLEGPTKFSDTAEVMTVEKDEDDFSLLHNSYPIINSYKYTDDIFLERMVWLRFNKLQNLLSQNIPTENILVDFNNRIQLSPHTREVVHSYSCLNDTLDVNHPSVHGGNVGGINLGWVSNQTLNPPFGNTTLVRTFDYDIWPDNTELSQWQRLFQDNQSNTMRSGRQIIDFPYPNLRSIVTNEYGMDYYNVDPLIRHMFNRNRIGHNVQPAFSFRIFYPTSLKGVNNIRCYRSNNAACNEHKPTLQFYYYDCQSIVDSFYTGYPGEGAYCPVNDTLIPMCISKYSNTKFINPYVEGVWGNWRVDTTYVYYGDRLESTINILDPLLDTRTSGSISNFKSFWNFGSTLDRNYSANDVWVWNNTITQYNRKGYEIENHDPLGRYNAGLYGYNQQLPIAVVNNARYREAMFDGFEDYKYKTSGCADFNLCKPVKHLRIPGIEKHLDTLEQHTGKYSIKLVEAQHLSFNVPISDPDDRSYDVRFRMDSTLAADTSVAPIGTGLTATYLSFPNGTCKNNAFQAFFPECANSVLSNHSNSPNVVTRIDPQVKYSYNKRTQQHAYILPPTGFNSHYAVRWEGFLQAEITGKHKIITTSDDAIRLWINNVLLIDNWSLHSAMNDDFEIHLVAGNLYNIKIEHFQSGGSAASFLLWQKPGSDDVVHVPMKNLYPVGQSSNANGTVSIQNKWCIKPDSLKVTGNATVDSFVLVKGQKMLLSAWVKEGNADCKCSTYINNSITLEYPGSGSPTMVYTPNGSIIEGWQRYEIEFTPPVNATSVTIKLNNTGTSAVYFDDLRILPFNSNMKSFVYHGVSLRLMAELDENNYASFYEYDDDGTLTRVKKETYKGIKTIKETRSALQKNED